MRDLAFAQQSTQSRWGYKRAAGAMLSLPSPIETWVSADGTIAKIPHIGPASTRVILEGLQQGGSPLVERVVEESPNRADVLRRRELRSNFLSRASVNQVLRADLPGTPALADCRADF